MPANNDGDSIAAGETNHCQDGTELIATNDKNDSRDGNDYVLQISSRNTSGLPVVGLRAFGTVGVDGIAGLNGKGLQGKGGAVGAYCTGTGTLAGGFGAIGVYGFGDNAGTGVHGVGGVGVVGASGVENWPGPFAVPTLGPAAPASLDLESAEMACPDKVTPTQRAVYLASMPAWRVGPTAYSVSATRLVEPAFAAHRLEPASRAFRRTAPASSDRRRHLRGCLARSPATALTAPASRGRR